MSQFSGVPQWNLVGSFTIFVYYILLYSLSTLCIDETHGSMHALNLTSQLSDVSTGAMEKAAAVPSDFGGKLIRCFF